MTFVIYTIGTFVVFLLVVAFGQKSSGSKVATGFIRVSGFFSIVLACLVLIAPFRFDVSSIAPTSYPITDEQQRLTNVLFTFACFAAAVVLFGNGLRILRGEEK